MDGERAAFKHKDEWLATGTPAGSHTFVFRYRPWDAPLGLVLTIIGLVLCGWLWLRKPSNASIQAD